MTKGEWMAPKCAEALKDIGADVVSIGDVVQAAGLDRRNAIDRGLVFGGLKYLERIGRVERIGNEAVGVASKWRCLEAFG